MGDTRVYQAIIQRCAKCSGDRRAKSSLPLSINGILESVKFESAAIYREAKTSHNRILESVKITKQGDCNKKNGGSRLACLRFFVTPSAKYMHKHTFPCYKKFFDVIRHR